MVCWGLQCCKFCPDVARFPCPSHRSIPNQWRFRRNREPTDCLYYLVSRVTLTITSALRKEFGQAGLAGVKPAYLGVLFALWNRDGLKVVELGRKAGLEPSTMTGLLDRMERDALLLRRADSSDRRVLRIFLTARGRRLRSEVESVVDRVLDDVFHGIDGTQLRNAEIYGQRRCLSVPLW